MSKPFAPRINGPAIATTEKIFTIKKAEDGKDNQTKKTGAGTT